MKAQEYLKELGINLSLTTLLSVIDGAIRQPDFCHLMEEYANYKIEEYKKSQLTAEKK